MTRELVTSIEINASSEVVWKILTDFDRFADWNPFIPSIYGEVAQGNKLQVEIQPPGGKVMTLRPTVLAAEPKYELRWLGHFLLPGIFDGEHCFQIESVSDRRVRVIHREAFSGVLVPLFWKRFIDQQTRQGFEAMNHALKIRAEQYVATSLQ